VHKLASKTGLLSSMLANLKSHNWKKGHSVTGVKWHTVSVADPAQMKCNFGTKDRCYLENIRKHTKKIRL